jgi:hypothetical protein
MLKPRAVLAIELVSSLAGAQALEGRQANVEHGLLRSSADPGEVFENAPAGCGRALFPPRLVHAVKVSKVAPLPQRAHPAQQLRSAPFG